MEKNKEMIEALKNLNEAFKEVDEAWDKCETMDELKTISVFPFGKSFDEVRFEVEDWVEETIEALEEQE